MRLEARVKKLELERGTEADMSGYDDWVDYRGHVYYQCGADGTNALAVPELVTYGHESEIWALHPAGTKFRRCGGGDYEVIDGVKRELHFPPSDKKPSPEALAAIGWLFEEYPN